jgi:glucosamine-phosphate N-acetyltransferase
MAFYVNIDKQYTVDNLQLEDYNRGFLQLLEQLTVVNSESINYEAFEKRFEETKNNIFIIRKNNLVIATASLFITKRFIRQLGSVGHVEDVVVNKEYRGHGLGKLLIKKLIEKAKEEGCYKIILDCSDENIVFYEGCGFIKKENQMVNYLI